MVLGPTNAYGFTGGPGFSIQYYQGPSSQTLHFDSTAVGWTVVAQPDGSFERCSFPTSDCGFLTLIPQGPAISTPQVFTATGHLNFDGTSGYDLTGVGQYSAIIDSGLPAVDYAFVAPVPAPEPWMILLLGFALLIGKLARSSPRTL
jgi:hypothetical protein